MSEHNPGEEPVVVEDDGDAQARMQELEERINAQGGVEPEIPDDSTRGGFGSPATVLAEAKKHVGYRETGENDTKFTRWLGKIVGYPSDGFGYPWCHAFVSYCLWHSDNADTGPRTASCPAGASWFKQRSRFSSTPQAGDLVYYGKDGGTHVELVTAVSAGTIQTIGGNTSGSLGGNFFNGDGVYEKTVDRASSRIHGFGHPEYSSGGAAAGAGGDVAGRTATPGKAAAGAARPAGKPMTTVRTIKQQQEAVNGLGFTPALDADGEWGPKTEAGIRWLQKKVGAGVDGEWGNGTETKFLAFKG